MLEESAMRTEKAYDLCRSETLRWRKEDSVQ